MRSVNHGIAPTITPCMEPPIELKRLFDVAFNNPNCDAKLLLSISAFICKEPIAFGSLITDCC